MWSSDEATLKHRSEVSHPGGNNLTKVINYLFYTWVLSVDFIGSQLWNKYCKLYKYVATVVYEI